MVKAWINAAVPEKTHKTIPKMMKVLIGKDITVCPTQGKGTLLPDDVLAEYPETSASAFGSLHWGRAKIT